MPIFNITSLIALFRIIGIIVCQRKYAISMIVKNLNHSSKNRKSSDSFCSTSWIVCTEKVGNAVGGGMSGRKIATEKPARKIAMGLAFLMEMDHPNFPVRQY